MQPPEEPTEVETSAAPVPGADVSTKTTQEMVSPEPPAAAKEAASRTEVATSEQPQKNEAGQEDTGPSASRGSAQSHLQRRRSLGNRCIRATQRKNGRMAAGAKPAS